MGFESWHAFYDSDWQAVYGLQVLPALFLGWLLATGRWRASAGESRDARFVRLYALGFSVETLVDPVATGPLLGALDWGATGGTVVGLLFVLLGDFRVFLLLFALSDDGAPRSVPVKRALAFAPLVAVGGFALNAALGAALGALPGQVLWLCHELLFVAMALWLRHNVVSSRLAPAAVVRRAALQRITSFVALYYALWATCDVLILAGLDAGWLLRVIPNQLYYAVWVPFVYFSLGAVRGPARDQQGAAAPGSRGAGDGR